MELAVSMKEKIGSGDKVAAGDIVFPILVTGTTIMRLIFCFSYNRKTSHFVIK